MKQFGKSLFSPMHAQDEEKIVIFKKLLYCIVVIKMFQFNVRFRQLFYSYSVTQFILKPISIIQFHLLNWDSHFRTVMDISQPTRIFRSNCFLDSWTIYRITENNEIIHNYSCYWIKEKNPYTDILYRPYSNLKSTQLSRDVICDVSLYCWVGLGLRFSRWAVILIKHNHKIRCINFSGFIKIIEWDNFISVRLG